MSYSFPRTIEEARATVRTHADAAFIAGGTDLMVQRAQGNDLSKHLIDISGIAEMREVTLGTTVSIGAGVTLVDIIHHPALQEKFPTLVEAARSIASPVIRTSATIGGNLLCENRCVYYDQSEFWRDAVGFCLKCGGDVCIATGGTKHCYSVFISDIAPVLICLGARAEYVDANGAGSCAVESLYTGEGTAPHTLSAGALMTRIVIPAVKEGELFFRKIRPRASVDFTNLTLAMRFASGKLTLAASGIGPAPAVVRNAIVQDPEELAVQLLDQSQIIDNLPYQRLYRKEMLDALVREGVAALVK